MIGIDYLFLNFLFILVGVLTYFSFGFNKSKHNKSMIGLFNSIAVIFCMSFPFTIFPGYFYDLRILPLLIAILYGGFGSGLMVALVLISYRYYLGGGDFGSGFLVTCISIIPMFICSVVFLRYQRSRSKEKHIIFGTFMAIFYSLLVTVSSIIKSNEIIFKHNIFFIYYCGLVVVCAWVTLYIIETIKENITMLYKIHHSEKLNVLGELAATIAHEIRNPLTVSKGFLQLLSARMSNQTDLKYSKLALEELDRAESIISEYLMYAKPQIGKIERVNVGDLLNNVLNIIESFITSNGHTATCTSEESLYIHADRKKITQVLINLIKNAVEAMEHQGKITINAFTKGDNTVIEIIDTGSGMGKEQISRLGNPFYSTKTNGTGLGLMVSYRIIEDLNGEIQVESIVGKGTKFSVVIPKA